MKIVAILYYTIADNVCLGLTTEYIYIWYNKVKNSSSNEICISTFNINMNSREI